MKKAMIITTILCICIIAGGIFFLSGKDAQGNTRMEAATGKIGLSFASMMVKQSKRNLKNLPPEMKLLPNLFDAVEANDVAKVAALLAEGAPANSIENATSDTPLFIAIKNNNPRIVQLLLTYNANPYQVTEDGYLPIHMALHPDVTGDPEDMKSFEAIIKALLAAGVSINQRNLWGETPFMLACKGLKKDAAGFFLVNGADMDLKTPEGKTALDISKEKDSWSCIWYYDNRHLFDHHKKEEA